ncbi:MAG: sugar-binding protein [Cellulomonadaceae bacterium]|jgi:putative multiple sugar transport system substrate-binding protein|nr:sugar-binding protein [Cellulomonadaceae bacterium]
MTVKSWKKLVAVAAAGLSIISLGACAAERGGNSGGDSTSSDNLIGISMPTRSLERWNNDGEHLESLLQDKGFATSLQFADNRVDQQISQLQNMINDGADVLVIAAIDGTALSPVLQSAADAGVTVVAYDRLINRTPNVDYYATFDNELVGQMQGEFIRDSLNLDEGAGPFNIELFAGSPDDNNARFFFAGAWGVLEQYFTSGQLVSPSGNVPASLDQWTQIGIQGWSSQTAQDEMETRLNSFYTDGKTVDVVLSPNDSLAIGIAQALQSAGYSAGDSWPIITGQDADVANVQNMIDGLQAMTVWKDTRSLGAQVATMVDQIVNGQTVDVNDTETYNNGVKVVPTFLITPQVIVRDEIQGQLIDSGFIQANQLHGLN